MGEQAYPLCLRTGVYSRRDIDTAGILSRKKPDFPGFFCCAKTAGIHFNSPSNSRFTAQDAMSIPAAGGTNGLLAGARPSTGRGGSRE